MRTTAANQAGDRDNEVVTLVAFAAAHLEGALKLSQEMSWPYRIEDWDVALQLGQGFVLQRSGVVIGTAAWWPYGETHASAGMIIVAKAAQGRGYGARLMDALLASARPRTIALNSTAEGITLYRRRGFVPIGVIHQHHGIPRECREAPRSCLVRSMVASDFEAIMRLDREATGLERRRLLDRLVQSGVGYVLQRDGIPRGYAISRLFGRGHVIGPVVAESPIDARALIDAALAVLGGCFVRIDTSVSSQLGDWLESIGLQQVGEATTMILGTPAPSTGPARTFAIANQSFG
ncbi:GNAT family N-acetyltransferase [Bradyrhizobium ontarionense]|uniref:GNAT family N-acetyltransferase n=1 Tax=Bradyrhizobium ontarionense TaxID=2898149 RepID=A0ABY3RKA9_9BRAD|nr:GNAT family N-acetyltransferase [Bradyrhizobium sp. A19]UFZ07854.1 GNAT family N-acetyltransferase [Bradyrhizobium sp. A19]